MGAVAAEGEAADSEEGGSQEGEGCGCQGSWGVLPVRGAGFSS